MTYCVHTRIWCSNLSQLGLQKRLSLVQAISFLGMELDSVTTCLTMGCTQSVLSCLKVREDSEQVLLVVPFLAYPEVVLGAHAS